MQSESGEAADDAVLREFAERRLAGDPVRPADFARARALPHSFERRLARIAALTDGLGAKRSAIRRIERREACRFLAFLGAGGMGEVWLARLRAGDRLVAIKTLRTALSEDQRRALSNEVEAVSRLDHPWIVRVIAVRWGDPPYVVMEYVAGVTVGDAVAGGGDRASLGAYLFAKIADALAFAHARGVVHGDIKPENVLVDENLDPRILDFGLSSLGGTVFADGARGGTRGYAPPERFLRGGADGPWSDTYSLCVMLREVLRGDGTGGDAARIPRGLRRILNRGVRASPLRRYRSAASLARDLRLWLNGSRVVHTALSARGVLMGAALAVLLGAGVLSLGGQPAAVPGPIERAVRQMIRQGDRTAAEALVRRALEGPAGRDRSGAIRAAGRYFAGRFTDELLDLLRAGDSPESCSWTLWALSRGDLARLSEERRWDLLVSIRESLRDSNRALKRAALSCLSHIDAPDRDGLLRGMILANDPEMRLALEALARSPAPEDLEFVRGLLDDREFLRRTERQTQFWVASVLLRSDPGSAAEVWDTLLDEQERCVASGDDYMVVDWMTDTRYSEPLPPATRARICSYLREAYSMFDGARPCHFDKCRAILAMGNFALRGTTIGARSVSDWLLDVAREESYADARLCCAEAVARISAKQPSHPPKDDARFVAAIAALDDSTFDGDSRSWVTMTKARMHAWVGDLVEAGRLAREAVDRGYCNWPWLRGEPFSDHPDLLRELRWYMESADHAREWPEADLPRRVREPSREFPGIDHVERRHLLVRDRPKVVGWSVRARGGDWDPTHGREEFILVLPFRSSLTLTFSISEGELPDRAILALGVRAYLDEALPDRSHAEIDLIVNDNRILERHQVLDHSTGVSLEITGDLREGENVIEIRLGTSLTVLGIREIALDGRFVDPK